MGNGNYYAGPAERLGLQREGLHFSYEGTYNNITPGFVTIPGFVNRVDIRETQQNVRYRFRPKHGWILSWGPSLNLRYDFDHTGLRLDTDYAPYLAIQGRGQTFIYLRPYEESRERLRPQDFCFYGYSLYCAPTTLGNEDYHQHTSGATVQTGYLKKATIAASYYWGDGVNFVALAGVPPAAPTVYNQPFLAREDMAGVSLTLRPIKPLKIENSYLFERLRTNNPTYLFEQTQLPGIGRGIFNDHILRSKWNWQFTPKLSVRLILQYNALLAGTPGIALHLSAHPEGIQYRLPHYLPRASRHRDLCRLQQRPAEPGRGPADSNLARLRHQYRQGLHQRQPPVFREGELFVPVLKKALSFQLSAFSFQLGSACRANDLKGLAES